MRVRVSLAAPLKIYKLLVFIEYNRQFFNMGVGLILDTSLLINETN